MEYYSKDVGMRIKNLRRQKNMTQMQLAEKLCYATERQLQRIENGETICPTDRLAELAKILNTSADYLLFGQDKRWDLDNNQSRQSIGLKDVIIVILKEEKM